MTEAYDKVFLVTSRRTWSRGHGRAAQARLAGAQDHARGRRVAAALERQVYVKLIEHLPEEAQRPPEILGATDDLRTTRQMPVG